MTSNAFYQREKTTYLTEKYTFSRFVYFDTGIISQVIKSMAQGLADIWKPLFEFLTQNDLTLGLSGATFVEIHDADRLHSNIPKLCISVPSALLKDFQVIIAEEIQSYPSHRTETLLWRTLNDLLLKPSGPEEILEFLSSDGLAQTRQEQLFLAKHMSPKHLELKENFPPMKSGKYSRHQADKFTNNMVIQWLSKSNPDFLLHNSKNFRPESFLSIRLFAYVIFYKYYLGNRTPKPGRTSEFGDLGHLFYLPYCELAVMERDLCEILNQIKRHHNTLESTVIRNIDFLEDWEWK